jgi:hypothetical protein
VFSEADTIVTREIYPRCPAPLDVRDDRGLKSRPAALDICNGNPGCARPAS